MHHASSSFPPLISQTRDLGCPNEGLEFCSRNSVCFICLAVGLGCFASRASNLKACAWRQRPACPKSYVKEREFVLRRPALSSFFSSATLFRNRSFACTARYR